MYQGTTPTHIFKLPFSVGSIEEISVCYIQNESIIFKKTSEHCTLADDEIRVDFTQEETLKFSYLTPVRIEIKVLTSDKKVIASVIESVAVKRMINKEVFSV